MKYITIRKYPFKGFYVVDTKARCADYCRWNLFFAIETFIWYLGVNPKYAFLHLRIKKIFTRYVSKRFKNRR